MATQDWIQHAQTVGTIQGSQTQSDNQQDNQQKLEVTEPNKGQELRDAVDSVANGRFD